MSLLERISVDPTVRFGKPCVRGTRITVGDVLGYLAGGMTEAEILNVVPAAFLPHRRHAPALRKGGLACRLYRHVAHPEFGYA